VVLSGEALSVDACTTADVCRRVGTEKAERYVGVCSVCAACACGKTYAYVCSGPGRLYVEGESPGTFYVG